MARRAFQFGAHCGDRCAIFHAGESVLVCIVDGLGHGEPAEEAAVAAVEYVDAHRQDSLDEIFAGCDEAIRGTRGVAMGLTLVDPARSLARYASIGNTRCAFVSATAQYFNGANGIVGNGIGAVLSETVSIARGTVLAMWTDGLPEVLDFARYRSSLRHSAQEAAEAILEDYASPNDDSGIVLYRKD